MVIQLMRRQDNHPKSARPDGRNRLRRQPPLVAQQLVRLAFFRRVGHFNRLDLTHRLDGFAFRIHKIDLEAARHHTVALLLVGHGVAGEALVVEQFQQRGEGFLVAVVRCGHQENVVLEVRRNAADQAGALTFERLARGHRGCDVVRLVHHEDVELARI